MIWIWSCIFTDTVINCTSEWTHWPAWNEGNSPASAHWWLLLAKLSLSYATENKGNQAPSKMSVRSKKSHQPRPRLVVMFFSFRNLCCSSSLRNCRITCQRRLTGMEWGRGSKRETQREKQRKREKHRETETDTQREKDRNRRTTDRESGKLGERKKGERGGRKRDWGETERETETERDRDRNRERQRQMERRGKRDM